MTDIFVRSVTRLGGFYYDNVGLEQTYWCMLQQEAECQPSLTVFLTTSTTHTRQFSSSDLDRLVNSRSKIIGALMRHKDTVKGKKCPQ